MVFGLSDDETCLQWCRVKDNTCSHTNTFLHDSKHQTKNHTETNEVQTIQAPIWYNHCVYSIAKWGTNSHMWLGMRNFPLPGSVEVQRTRRHGATVWTVYTFIYPIQNILRILKVRKGTRVRTMNWYQNIRFKPLTTWGHINCITDYLQKYKVGIMLPPFWKCLDASAVFISITEMYHTNLRSWQNF